MRNVLGINFSYSDKVNLRELIDARALASLPIAGKYRIIDFILSGFVNAGIYDVSVITKNNYHSLADHIGSGKDWDMTRKRGGLRILSPLSNNELSQDTENVYRGTLDALYCHMSSIHRSSAEYVILTGSSVVCCDLDYRDLIEKHMESKSDITVVYTKNRRGIIDIPQKAPILMVDREKRITDMQRYDGDSSIVRANWAVGIYVINKSLLESLVSDCIPSKMYSWHEDILKRLLSTLRITGYEYNKLLFEISTVTGYMKANMNFLKADFRKKAFSSPIFTKTKNNVPALYTETCSVKHSLIADGCIIEGEVSNSILSRGVKIGKGSIVKNCIIMQDTEIMQNVILDNVIVDKDAIIRNNKHIVGHEIYPVVVKRRSIV